MSPRRDTTRMVLGARVVLIGVFALADNLLQINTRQVLQFWPVVFMLVGAVKLSQTRRASGYVVGAVFLSLGVLLSGRMWAIGRRLKGDAGASSCPGCACAACSCAAGAT